MLAIKGHATRGKEIIEILEMLGGKNIYKLDGEKDLWYILSNSTIEYSTYLFEKKGYMLEEFLEKFPYKIGDKVKTKALDFIGTIINMQWVNNENTIVYKVEWNDDTKSKLAYYSNRLQPYTEQKEETIKTITIDDFKANTKEWLIDKLHDMLIGDAVKTVGNLYDELHKPQYPKTYEECCKIMGLDKGLTLFYGNYDCTPIHITEYSGALEQLLNNFMQLLIRRDAYWKIAGDWKPDWTDENQPKFVVSIVSEEIEFYKNYHEQKILAFPTVEMRNAFCKNFKELINECKKLL